jgi:hypothetical protein
MDGAAGWGSEDGERERGADGGPDGVYKWRGPLIYLTPLFVGARTAFLFKKAQGTRGTQGSAGSLFGGLYLFIGISYVFCGYVLDGHFLTLFSNNIFELIP